MLICKEKMSPRSRVVALRVSLLLLLMLAWRVGARPTCAACLREDVTLVLGDGRPVSARLYTPVATSGEFPAVVIVHGYLGNSGFMEIPWAEDLTRAGIAAFFVDKIGHGWTTGAWWPTPSSVESEADLVSLYPEIHAAIAHLRHQVLGIDRGRIALLGHSDGGTGSIIAATADWEVAATVSLSASLAPAEYVNHVVPRNFFLVYGAEDRFILDETDRVLIENATRGYLDGEGAFGSIAAGDARRLLRVAGRGHVDVVYDDEARLASLTWLRQALAPESSGGYELSPLRTWTMVAGITGLVLLLSVWNGVPTRLSLAMPTGRRLARVLIAVGLWVVAMIGAGQIAPRLEFVPVAEARTVVAILVAGAAFLAPLAWIGWRSSRPASGTTRQLGFGVAVGLGATIAVEQVLAPMYSMAVTPQRLALSALLATVAIPCFAIICTALAPSNEERRDVLGGPMEWVLAAITVPLAWGMFTRMSILPALLMALVLLLTGAFRAGGAGVVAAAAFGGVMYSRLTGLVCAFY